MKEFNNTEQFTISCWILKQKRFPRKTKKLRKKMFGDRWQYFTKSINR